MHLARLSVVLFAVAGASASANPRLELEVGGGVSTLSFTAPTLEARVGVDLFGWLTPSVRVISLSQLSFREMEWSVLAELRAHTTGLVQLTGGLAVGVASAYFTHAYGTLAADAARVQPYLLGDIGLRIMLGPVWLGAAVAGAPVSKQLMLLGTVGVVFGKE